MPPSYPFPTPLPTVPGGFLLKTIAVNNATSTPTTCQIAYKFSGLGTPPTAEEVGTAFAVPWATLIVALMPVYYELQAIGVYDLSDPEAAEVQVPAVAVGSHTGLLMPPNITARVKLTTNVRRKRGDIHLSPIRPDNVTPEGNHLAPTFAEDLLTDVTACLRGFETDAVWGGEGADLCVMSKITNKLYDGRLIPVDQIIVPADLGSQRRRRGY